MWSLFQIAVVIGVVFHSIYFEWNQNGMAVGVIAVGAAYCLTWLLTRLGDRVHRWKVARQQKRTNTGVGFDL